MRVSEKKASATFKAISDPITNLRIESIQGEYSLEELDEKLFELEQKVWKRVVEALNLETQV